MDSISPLLLIGSIALFVHALFSLYLLLYSWEYPERLEASHGPIEFVEPRTGFSILLPARDESGVIGATIRRIWAADYPRHLLQIIVICHEDDESTIAEVESVIREIGSQRVRLTTFGGTPINKPRALNVGLAVAEHNMVGVVDAEDDVDPQLLNSVNTVAMNEGATVVQAGVQLMNFRDRWWSVHNCLEYFFWFKSRLHFHAKVGMIPLGGNTVFVKRELLRSLGGWDETCLTEDADIGLRISTLGERIRVIYDSQRVTREETPKDLSALVRQRTRWNQGFMHVLRKGSWLGLPTWQQRALAIYTFSYPIVQGPITLLWPLAIIAGFILKVPVPVAIASFLPLYAMLFQLVLMVVGAFMFGREYGLRVPRLMPLTMVLTFMPYQWVLGYSAARAAYRELQHDTEWEKTDHVGAHRRPTPTPAASQIARPLRWWQRAPLRDAWRLSLMRGTGDLVPAKTRPDSQPAGSGLPAASQLSYAALIRATFESPAELAEPAEPTSASVRVAVGPRGCPTCGRTTPYAVRFCRRCGSRMQPVFARAPGPIAPAPVRIPVFSRHTPALFSPKRHLRLLSASLALSLITVLSLFEIIPAQVPEPSRQADRPTIQQAAPQGDSAANATRRAHR